MNRWLFSVLLILGLVLSFAAAQKTLRIAIEADPINLDPAQIAGMEAHRFMTVLYPTLLRYNENLELVPHLAESYEIIDERTYEFVLRPDVVFHDGTPLTAHDVKASINRVLDPDVPSPEAFELEPIERVEIIDDHTLRVITHDVFPGMLHGLTFGLGVHPEGAEDQVDLRHEAIGTGPFRLVEYEPDVRLVLERFDDYFGPAPALDRVVYYIMPDDAARSTAVRAGDVDVARFYDPKSIEPFEARDDLEVGRAAAPRITFFYFNTRVEPFDDARVRLAMSCAIDRNAIAEFVYFGHANPTGPIPPAMTDWAIPADEFECYGGADVERAQELLAEAGYPDGFSATISATSRFPLNIENAEVIREQLAVVGIHTDIEVMEFGQLLDMMVDTLDYELAVRPSNSGRDPDANFYRRFHCDSDRNTTGYCNPEVDRLMDLSRVTVDYQERFEIFAELQRLLTSESPKIFLTDEPYYEVYHESLENWIVHPQGMHYHLDQVDLVE